MTGARASHLPGAAGISGTAERGRSRGRKTPSRAQPGTRARGAANPRRRSASSPRCTAARERDAALAQAALHCPSGPALGGAAARASKRLDR
ncbi:hypothetical protein NDU88_011267 [Pleurodeles waltl]|uniref:Uncharacterized protein n=1 Tax=Pleurodeles waltl TaxID=8319 RepID=A0AAV7PXA3_PLEWA|nr:hypothetical protein NDU88_011267 [Pleurodeles waltl]